jgi:hypothetical protein
MVKRNLRERQIIGEIQLIFGIILLISGIVGIILDYSSYNSAINQNDNTYIDFLKGLDSIQNSNTFSNDTVFIGRVSYSTLYIEENHQITEDSIIIGLLCILGIIFSLFFLTQGLLNSSDRER